MHLVEFEMKSSFPASGDLSRRVLLSSLAALPVVIGALHPDDVHAQTEPLPSWNEGTTKSSIIDFVTRVSAQGGPGYVAPADRIAVFDNDGTLWVE